ncbi:hypothetical protein AFV1_ORF146 [Captovirus AFV1]|uniref:Uncharacterized protein ORF146 n=1 Tax=Acidianus filamentous virus 1 (isolate United States/Yellowstone) TaxID=654909 RepID=Y146_AFV1Y|nr:hypothetical protein AFV1_ORF146 [Captovirus AFV1]Q70LC4.1 RecName: Full=Uncharacterized protein ORF146 [Acidianus filamentous virus 1 (isolate Yellowstone)]CAD98956.1 hypothetical protein [Captovirus AFV1]
MLEEFRLYRNERTQRLMLTKTEFAEVKYKTVELPVGDSVRTGQEVFLNGAWYKVETVRGKKAKLRPLENGNWKLIATGIEAVKQYLNVLTETEVAVEENRLIVKMKRPPMVAVDKGTSYTFNEAFMLLYNYCMENKIDLILEFINS